MMMIMMVIKCRGSNSVQQERGDYSLLKQSFDVCCEEGSQKRFSLLSCIIP